MIARPATVDPIEFGRLQWPHIKFYPQQCDIIYSVIDNDETVVPAGNELGKDFVAAFIILWFFCGRQPARVVATGPSERQVEDVLWGEIKRFIDTAKYKLPILYNHLHLRRLRNDGSVIAGAEVRGQVVRAGESLQGRHTPRGVDGLPMTLAVFDEASAIGDTTYTSSDTWAHRKLIIGNPMPCQNFFYRGVKGGDEPNPYGNNYWRKVIKIRAIDSPNVQIGLRTKGRNREILVPGLVCYDDYRKRRDRWDPIQQSWGLDAEFYEDAELLLFPPEWLNVAEERAVALGGPKRKPLGRTFIGCDPAEGGDSTVWVVIDAWGIIEVLSMKTANTAMISGFTIQFIRKYGTDPQDVIFDRGGGGKQHADYLREKGYQVRTVLFDESVTPAPEQGCYDTTKVNKTEERTTYVNRRAQMYHLASMRFDPQEEQPWALPREYTELRRQLAPMPRLYNPEGRMYLPPKRKKPGQKNSDVVTIEDMLGCSPDEADALTMAAYAMHEPQVVIGAF